MHFEFTFMNLCQVNDVFDSNKSWKADHDLNTLMNDTSATVPIPKQSWFFQKFIFTQTVNMKGFTDLLGNPLRQHKHCDCQIFFNITAHLVINKNNTNIFKVVSLNVISHFKFDKRIISVIKVVIDK